MLLCNSSFLLVGMKRLLTLKLTLFSVHIILRQSDDKIALAWVSVMMLWLQSCSLLFIKLDSQKTLVIIMYACLLDVCLLSLK